MLAEAEENFALSMIQAIALYGTSSDDTAAVVCGTQTSSVGKSTAWGLPAETDGNSSRGLSACDAGTASSQQIIEVPASALGNKTSLIVLTEVDIAHSNTIFPDGNLATQPLSIRLFDDAGLEKTVAGLAEPILLTLAPEAPVAPAGMEPFCAYWDEGAQSWSVDGMAEVPDQQGAFKCSTTHLTVFAVIFARPRIECFAIGERLFSEDGFRALSDSAWLLRPAALCFAGAVVLQVALVERSRRADRRASKQRLWNDGDLFVGGRSEVLVGKAKLTQMVRDMASVESTASVCDRLAVARAKGVARQDVRGLVDAAAAGSAGALDSALGQSVLKAQPDILVDFWSAGFSTRVRILFWAMHPWLDMGHLGLTLRASHRALLFSARLSSSAALGALFFAVWDGSSSRTSDDECGRGVWSLVGRNVLVGLVAATLSTLPLMLISRLPRRRFIYGEGWNDRSKALYIFYWKFTDVAFVAATMSYTMSCTFLVAIYLANASVESGLHWVFSVAVGMARDIIVLPAVAAATLAGVSVMIEVVWPEVVQRSQQRSRSMEASTWSFAPAGVDVRHVSRHRPRPLLREMDSIMVDAGPGAGPPPSSPHLRVVPVPKEAEEEAELSYLSSPGEAMGGMPPEPTLLRAKLDKLVEDDLRLVDIELEISSDSGPASNPHGSSDSSSSESSSSSEDSDSDSSSSSSSSTAS